jgi:hypothetical protein
LGGQTVPGLGSFIAGTVLVMVFIFGIVSLVSFAVPYMVLRIKDMKSEKPDPQIGVKSAMYFFFSNGIMVFLFGLTILVVDLLVSGDDFRARRQFGPGPGDDGLSEAKRIGLAFMVSGLIFALLHLGLVKGMTNDRNPASRRIFAGWRMAIHGMVVLTTLTALLVVYFQRDMGDLRTRKALWGVMLVWIPSWILQIVLVWFYSQPLYEPSRSENRSEWMR